MSHNLNLLMILFAGCYDSECLHLWNVFRSGREHENDQDDVMLCTQSLTETFLHVLTSISVGLGMFHQVKES